MYNYFWTQLNVYETLATIQTKSVLRKHNSDTDYTKGMSH